MKCALNEDILRNDDEKCLFSREDQAKTNKQFHSNNDSYVMYHIQYFLFEIHSGKL